jgi:tetratricopeptide (TPR) repeat protein
VGYQRTSKRTPEIARELGVDGIVEGTVERDHGRVRIRVQLINAHTDEHFWAASFDGDGNDAFRLEANVASDVAQQIGRRLTARANQSASPGIPAPVYEEYLKGRYYWNKRTAEGLTKAITQFEQVIQEAPRFAPAYSGLADCYNLLTVYEDTMPADAFSKAKAAAMKAVELDEGLGAAHASLGEIYFRFDWDWEAAEKEFRRAIELEPGYSTAHHWYAEYLVAMGRIDEGIAEAERALELDPLSLIINADAGWFFEMAGKSDRALLQLHRTLELEPRFSPTHLYLGEAYLRKEMYPQAIAAYRESASLGDSSSSAPLGYAYGRSGKRAEARKIIEQLHRRPNMSPTSIAIVYTGLGNKDRAFALLEQAFKEHDDSLIYIGSQTFFDPLRSDPRFRDLLRRMKFPA